MHGGPTPLRVSTYTSYLLYKAQDPFSTGRQSQGGTFFLPWHLFFFSLEFTDQKTKEENMHGGQTPLWVVSYTGYLLYKVQDHFSAGKLSHVQDSIKSSTVYSWLQ